MQSGASRGTVISSVVKAFTPLHSYTETNATRVVMYCEIDSEIYTDKLYFTN